ncbi:hypothetical protein J2S59_003738 [Nocardioides massiliensis]|uniref:Uncharacterized protein n=3 Tax=Nocardioides massiliensis TaxID=1325935 RepID=A0ABT9NU26_9ACTN|nr:hypothetical protein [Nocardioides massiliensis]MDP9823929.1 hypothetical protein [Nocardioides massiliensis]
MSARVFFSFPEVVDPERHEDYNAWHQLDHRPENLALPGIVHGERWVRTPQCREAAASLGPDGDAGLSAAQYAAMYWFREPTEQSIREWVELGSTTAEEGRRPDQDWTRRRLTGFFAPLRGWVSPREAITTAALPFRPVRGVLLEVWRVTDPRGPAADAALRGLHRAVAESVEQTDGIVGAWSFASRRTTAEDDDGTTTGEEQWGRLQVVVRYCEDDPIELVDVLAATAPDPVLTPLLRTPLLTITPWTWDWFRADYAPGTAGR